jgi:Ca2+-binding RTX toxin-like protein
VGEGTDTIETSLSSYTLVSNVENLRATGLGQNLTGNALANVITGSVGNDILNGGVGADTLNGGDGGDIYYVDNADDVIVEGSGAASGFDSVYASVNTTLSINVEQLILTGVATVGIGNSGANGLYANLLFHGATLDGGAGHDVFYGSNYADTIIGGEGNDIFQGFYSVGGFDTLSGGQGDDVYYLVEAGDVITELAGEGLDTVYTQVNLLMSANLEQAVVYGVATTVTGNSNNNNLFGNNSGLSLTLDGGAGDDWIIGSNFSDTLLGGENNDILQGLGGTNTMSGGTGDDQYFSTSASDVITELAGEGRDTLYANYNITALAANVEQLVSYGGATIGNGNGLANTLYGNNNSVGMSLDGGTGDDLIFGSDYDDTLIGGLNNDTLLGLDGNDFYSYTTAGNMGADLIIGFDADAAGGQDIIALSGMGYTAASLGSNISIATSGADTLVSFTSGNLDGTSIRIAGIAASNVTAADFLF